MKELKKEEKEISRKTIRITYDSGIGKDQPFFTLMKKENNTVIFCLRKRDDLLKLMLALRKNLQFGIFKRTQECLIASEFLDWWKSYKVNIKFDQNNEFTL